MNFQYSFKKNIIGNALFCVENTATSSTTMQKSFYWHVPFTTTYCTTHKNTCFGTNINTILCYAQIKDRTVFCKHFVNKLAFSSSSRRNWHAVLSFPGIQIVYLLLCKLNVFFCGKKFSAFE